jgi:hypothetical protein
MRAYTQADVDALKAKWGTGLLPLDMPEHGIRMLLRPFDLVSFDRFADESLRDHDTAAEATLVRQLAFHTAAELKAARRDCPRLPNRALDVLCADAGLPLEAPAVTMFDPLDGAPETVLELAGLDEATAAKLLAEHASSRPLVVSVRDPEGDVIFGGVMVQPGEAETGGLERAQTARKGYGAACRAAADGCLVWQRESPAPWGRYPAIPVLILAKKISEMGGAGSTARFRSRL